jgi:hypothetical protein
LATVVARETWPTPTMSMLTAQDQEQARDHSSERPEYETGGGSLNPTWTEWLMGWPLAWTDCAPLETAGFRRWRQSLLDALGGGC